MNADKIQHLETLLERKLEPGEKERLRRIGHILGLHADDAIWDMLAAMEYQKTYYEILPEKISSASTEVLQGITVAAEAEVQRAQGRLAEDVAELAQKLAMRVNWSTLLPMGLCALVCMMLLGSTFMWTGFYIGSGQTLTGAHELRWILHMPSGVLMGILALVGGLFLSVHVARDFAEGRPMRRKELGAALAMLVAGAMLTALAL